MIKYDKMKYINSSILFFLLFILGCKDKPIDDIDKINVINNSEHTICIYVSHIYPDTSLNSISSHGCSEILPHTSCNAITRHGWKSEVSRNKQGKILFFISDNDTIRKYGVDTWIEHYLILKRYELTERNLEDMNWIITYP